jgi:hypothetical protein
MFPTSPLRKPDDMDNMIDMYNRMNVDFVTIGIPMKECFICKNEKPYQDRFGTVKQDQGFVAHEIIGDKFWNYSKPQWGIFVGSRDYFYKLWKESPMMDINNDTAEIDTKMPWNFYPIPEWQFFDIDYPEDLEIVQVLMEHYILKGRGPQVYYDYKESI